MLQVVTLNPQVSIDCFRYHRYHHHFLETKHLSSQDNNIEMKLKDDLTGASSPGPKILTETLR